MVLSGQQEYTVNKGMEGRQGTSDFCKPWEETRMTFTKPIVLSADGEVLQAPTHWFPQPDLQALLDGFAQSAEMSRMGGPWQIYRLANHNILVVEDTSLLLQWTNFLQNLNNLTTEPEILDYTHQFLQDGLGFEVLDFRTTTGPRQEIRVHWQRRIFSMFTWDGRGYVWQLRGERWEWLEQVATQVQKCLMRNQSLKRYLNALHYFQELQVSITDQMEWQETLKLVLHYTREALQADAAIFFMWDENAQMLELIDTIGHRTPTDYGYRIPRDEGLAGQVLHNMRTQVIADINPDDFNPSSRDFLLREGFKSYVGTPLMVKGELLGVLEVFHRETLAPSPWWLTFFELLASHVAISLYQHGLIRELKRSNQQLKHTYDATLEGWVKALDLRDRETEGHSKRVMEKSMVLARRMGIEGQDLEHIRRGALLHDIGKLGIPDQILHKPGKLTPKEYDVIKQHPIWAHTMLKDITYLQRDLDIPYYHHERWDGMGYPLGLHGEDIPLSARIFAVVDVWDAMISDRPYRGGLPRPEVLQHIEEQSGKHFDPKVVKAFLEMMEKEEEPVGLPGAEG